MHAGERCEDDLSAVEESEQLVTVAGYALARRGVIRHEGVTFSVVAACEQVLRYHARSIGAKTGIVFLPRGENHMLLLTLLACGDASDKAAPDNVGTDDSATIDSDIPNDDTGASAALPPILAAYAGEPRESEARADGYLHVDSPKLMDRLGELHVNTYAWLIYHSPSDWDDLSEYLALAEPAGLDTWVYLVPPAERPAYYPPFEGDYVAWAEAIGQLAASHPSITAIAMDDFNSDSDLFSGDYVCEMMSAAQAYAPDLKFYAVDYYPWVLVDMAAESDRRCIDGVIFPYMDLDSNAEMRAQIEAIAALRDGLQDTMQITYPWNHPSTAGDYGRYTATCAPGELSFAYRDDYPWDASPGYHFFRVRQDGALLAEEDISGDEAPGTTTLSLDGGELSISLEEDVAVYNFGVQINLTDFSAPSCGAWTWASNNDEFTGAFNTSDGWSELELIPMVYASATSWHPTEPSTEIIAEAVNISLQAQRDGLASGVITYCLNSDEGSAEFDAVSAIYGAASEP